MKLAIRLQQLCVLDMLTELKSKEQAYMLSSGSASQALISVDYALVPRESPIYSKVDHKYAVQFLDHVLAPKLTFPSRINAVLGTIDVSVNRPTVAALLHVVTQIMTNLAASAVKSQPVEPIEAPAGGDVEPANQEALQASAAAAAVPTDVDMFLAKVTLKVSSVGLHLNKDGATFWHTIISNVEAAVNVGADGSLTLPVRLD